MSEGLGESGVGDGGKGGNEMGGMGMGRRKEEGWKGGEMRWERGGEEFVNRLVSWE